jgi:SUKH-3 immunity protein
MKFTDKVQEQFKKAGWSESNNQLNKYNNIYKFEKFPDFLKDFLKEYGDLKVLDCKNYESEVTNQLIITPDYAFFEFEEDKDEDYEYYKSEIGNDIYPFAFIYPDNYRIACDSDGKVYMLSDYIFRISESLKEGIEILLKDDWSKGYFQLDVKSKQWIKDKKWDE